MASPRNRIGEILVKARVIDELQLRSALAQLDQWGGRLSRIVVDMRLASPDVVTEAISKGMGMPRMQLGNVPKDPGALAKLDVGFAEQKGVFPVALRDNGKTLVLAMSDPSDLETIDQVAARSRTRVVPVVAGDREIETAILRHYRGQEVTLTSRIGSENLVGRRTTTVVDDGEFKVTDMSGKTMVKHIASIAPSLAQQSPPPAAKGGSSAADLLDEIMAGSPAPAEVFSEEEMQRLRAVQTNQEKSSKILRALLELLLEKGMLNQRELASRLRS
jgi:hypothetical protein